MKNLLFIFLIFASSLCFGEVYKSHAEASYYAEKFHGRLTANGEKFNMYDYTCAHKELPFNTILKITNLDNNKTVNVRVNDRGPFVKGREIDLSKAAAVQLDMISSGTAIVKIEIISMGAQTKQSAQTANKAQKMMGGSGNTVETSSIQPVLKENALYDIQLGSFSNNDNAKNLAQKLLKDGFRDVAYQKAGNVTRVVIIKKTPEEVKKISADLKSKGYKDFATRERK